MASAVGLACIHVWGFRGPEALGPARAAGIALQLTNILRDLKEDAAAGRVYLPLDDLRAVRLLGRAIAAGSDRHAVPPPHGTGDRPRRGILSRRRAALGVAAAGPQRLFGMMMGTYRVLLRKIAQRPEDVFRRAHPPQRRKEAADCRPLGLAAAASLRADVAKQTLPVPPPAMTSIAARTAARVAVVGGGLAGLSAAAAAAEHGCRVELFEQAAALGGRAASFRDPAQRATRSTRANTWPWAAAPTSSTSAAAWAWPTASNADGRSISSPPTASAATSPPSAGCPPRCTCCPPCSVRST